MTMESIYVRLLPAIMKKTLYLKILHVVKAVQISIFPQSSPVSMFVNTHAQIKKEMGNTISILIQVNV